jgi:hypothetical protein
VPTVRVSAGLLLLLQPCCWARLCAGPDGSQRRRAMRVHGLRFDRWLITIQQEDLRHQIYCWHVLYTYVQGWSWAWASRAMALGVGRKIKYTSCVFGPSIYRPSKANRTCLPLMVSPPCDTPAAARPLAVWAIWRPQP